MSGYNQQQQGYPPQGYPPQMYPPQQHPQQYGYPPKYDQPNLGSAPNSTAGSEDMLYGGRHTPLHGNDGKFEFSHAPRFPDLWATILYLLNLIAFLALAGIGINHLVTNPPSEQEPSPSDPSQPSAPPLPSGDTLRKFIGVMGAFTGLAALASAFYAFLMRRFARQLIYFTFVLSIVLTAAMGVLMLAVGSVIGGVIYLVIAVLYLILFVVWRKRIPFAAALLQTVSEIGNKYPASYLFAFLSLLLSTVFSLFWMATFIGCTVHFSDPDDNNRYTVLTIFLVFSLYWTMQIIENTLHVTVAGTVASYYFLEGTSAMPKNPSLQSAKRAFTTSFGPIAFGSLIVALIEVLRYLLQSAARDNSLLAAIADCIMSCIQGLVEYFNRYAYIQVAMYGKSFCNAAKDTWSLLKSTGFEAVINDSFVGTAVNIGAFLVGLLAGGGTYVALMVLLNDSQETEFQAYMIGAAIAVFLVGILMMSIIGMYITSAVSTLYVCLAEDPAALARTKPQLYETFRRTYPQISWRV